MHKNKSNNSWVRLLKQVEESRFEKKEYGVKPIRHKSFYGTVHDGIWWDTPYRSKPSRSWKSYRDKQFK